MVTLCLISCALSCTRSILLTAAVAVLLLQWRWFPPNNETPLGQDWYPTPINAQRCLQTAQQPSLFSPLQCNCQGEYGVIQGSEAGAQLSKLVELLAKAVRQQFLGTQ